MNVNLGDIQMPRSPLLNAGCFCWLNPQHPCAVPLWTEVGEGTEMCKKGWSNVRAASGESWGPQVALGYQAGYCRVQLLGVKSTVFPEVSGLRGYLRVCLERAGMGLMQTPPSSR